MPRDRQRARHAGQMPVHLTSSDFQQPVGTHRRLTARRRVEHKTAGGEDTPLPVRNAQASFPGRPPSSQEEGQLREVGEQLRSHSPQVGPWACAFHHGTTQARREWSPGLRLPVGWKPGLPEICSHPLALPSPPQAQGSTPETPAEHLCCEPKGLAPDTRGLQVAQLHLASPPPSGSQSEGGDLPQSDHPGVPGSTSPTDGAEGPSGGLTRPRCSHVTGPSEEGGRGRGLRAEVGPRPQPASSTGPGLPPATQPQLSISY